MQLCLEGKQELTQTIRFSNALARANEENKRKTAE